jgi:D-alanyl-lipoteichoic acid acyltransferase DltB (MBOAT superfamily)
VFNTLVVWGTTGLWHGAAWNFILWGLYYAVMLGILLFFYIMPSFVGTDAYSYTSVFSRPADYLTQLYTPK